MRIIFTTFITYILFSHYIFSQSIYTALNLNKREYIKKGKIKEIILSRKYYGNSKISDSRFIQKFDNKNRLIYEERYENSQKMTARYIPKYDTITNLLVSRVFERWHPVIGYSKEKADYLYDSNNFHIGVIEYNANGDKFSETKIINDERGLPIELRNYDHNGNLLGGFEKAIYLEEENKVIISIYSSSGNKVSKDTMKFFVREPFKYEDETAEFNEQGDIIKSNVNDLGFELYEYKYDEIGNWVEKKEYEVTISDKGKEKKKIIYLRKRKITYW